MSKQKLTLQPGKTYVTNSGEHITLEEHESSNPFYTFYGSNDFYYGSNGRIFENDCEYDRDELSPFDRDISHELIQDTEDENWHDSFCDDCEFSIDETEVQLIEQFKFKQKDQKVKRTITFNDYSDSTVQIEFKTKTKGQEALIGGIRLSYEALDMLYNCLHEMHNLDEDRVYN